MSKVYRMEEDSIHHAFSLSRNKVQFFGGGFGNGKTAAAVVHKILFVGKNYPGANILVARETYPKLNDTIRKEFELWCPKTWIKSFPKGQNSSNTCTLVNGTTINFRYVAQQGKGSESGGTSNLLSATYDLVVVDQIEDPGIGHKDFIDLFGRLRGSTPIDDSVEDRTLPRTGPRWFIITANPTRNWVYKKIVRPLHIYNRSGHVMDDLIIRKRKDGTPVLNEDGSPQILIDLFEGSTYVNAANLEPDFIEGLEATYVGVMRDRFLLGNWAAYEGLVYPTYDESQHMLDEDEIEDYFVWLKKRQVQPTIVEGYDHGLQAPSCYIWGFTDHWGNVFLCDGFYKKEFPVEQSSKEIKRIQKYYGAKSNAVWADPQVFRRGTGDAKVVGHTVAKLFRDHGVAMQRGNNDIINGVAKVSAYIMPKQLHKHPIRGTYGAPHLFISKKLSWWHDEITDYYWDVDTSGEYLDKPRDVNDHAMDTTKYLLTKNPSPALIVPVPMPSGRDPLKQWQEEEDPSAAQSRRHRHAA